MQDTAFQQFSSRNQARIKLLQQTQCHKKNLVLHGWTKPIEIPETATELL
jgi:hypothetical protein